MDLKGISKSIREDVCRCIGSLGSGHIGGSLSVVDLLTVLYFKQMNVDPSNPQLEGRDRLVMSKGHAGPAVYATLANKGFFSREELLTLNKNGTNLPSHCDMNKTVGVDMTAGSLGQGFSCAVGIAIAERIKGNDSYVYAVIGDGESQEGQIWESAMYASQAKLDRFIAFTDYNGLQLDDKVDNICSLAPLADKWVAFGFDVQEIDGHDLDAIDNAINRAKMVKGKPHMIILDTIKGKGVSFVEEKGVGSHSMPLSPSDMEKAIEEIRRG